MRIDLHGRRVGGWVVELADEAGTDKTLKPLAKVTGWGPPADVVELAGWAAWRWAGRTSSLLKTASPPGAVRALPPVAEFGRLATGAVANHPNSVRRLPPAADVYPVVLEAAQRGPALVVTPSQSMAAHLTLRLRRAHVPVASAPREWARAMAGGCTVVGARAAAWAPVPDLAAVVVVDEHDEGLAEERAPTWNARDVAIERARRAGVPCTLVSPCPSLEALGWGELVAPSRTEEREGWPIVDVVDRRRDDPRLGLYSDKLTALVRSGRRVVCVLNRKGRARLLACAACGELARCESCTAAVEQTDDGLAPQSRALLANSVSIPALGLVCRRCGAVRPPLCLACGATRLKVLRVGVTRVREELEKLAGVLVGEVTGDTDDVPDTPVVIGTEAVLHRIAQADAVAFLDFDQELLAPRYRAAEEALALLARAARLVGGRAGGGRLLVQTRLPRHEVIDAALHADPSRVSDAERPRRDLLRLPPAAAMALVSGEAAEKFVEQLHGVDLLGPNDGRWLVKAPDHRRLCDALAAAERPPGRLRVEVDPVRA